MFKEKGSKFIGFAFLLSSEKVMKFEENLALEREFIDNIIKSYKNSL